MEETAKIELRKEKEKGFEFVLSLPKDARLKQGI